MKLMDVSLSRRRACALGAARIVMWCGLDSLVLAVPAWTAAQPGVTPALASGRSIAQVTENAKAGELNLEPADLARTRKNVIVLGEPAKG